MLTSVLVRDVQFFGGLLVKFEFHYQVRTDCSLDIFTAPTWIIGQHYLNTFKMYWYSE